MAKGKKTGGRQKGSKNILSTDIKYLAQAYGPDCIEVLYGLMINSKQDMVKLNAANSILDRGFGKPASMEQDDNGKDNLPQLLRDIADRLPN